MTTIEELVDQYVKTLEQIYENRTAGDYTFLGLLASFRRDMQALEGEETPEQAAQRAAERLATQFPDRPVQAIKELRTWLKDNNHDYGLKVAKDYIDVAREKLQLVDTIKLYRAPSDHTPILHYNVVITYNSRGMFKRASCTCQAFRYSGDDRDCKHVRRARAGWYNEV